MVQRDHSLINDRIGEQCLMFHLTYRYVHSIITAVNSLKITIACTA